MFFANKVPPKARSAYNRDAMSGMLGAVMSGLTGPFTAVIARKTLHASEFEMAIISMAPVAGNLFSLVWAKLMEGRRKMPFAIISWVIARALLLLVLFATSSSVFIGIVAAMNILSSIAGPAYSALMKEIYPDGDRAKIMGYVRVCTWFVLVIFTLIGGPLLGLHKNMYRYVFPIAGVFGIISAFIFGRIFSAEASGDASVPLGQFLKDSALIMKEDPGFRWFSSGIFLFGFANFFASPAYLMYQVDVLGVDTDWASIYATVSSVIMVISYFFWGSYIDCRRPERVVAYQALTWAGIPLIYIAASHPWMLLPSAMITGVMGSGTELSYFSGVLHFAPKERLTQYQGVFAVQMGIRGVIAPWLGAMLVKSHVFGMISTHADSMRFVFGLSSMMILVSVIIQLYGAKRYGTVKPQLQG